MISEVASGIKWLMIGFMGIVVLVIVGNIILPHSMDNVGLVISGIFSPLTSVLEPLYDLAGQVLELFAVIVSALIGFIAWFIQRSTSSSNSGGGGTHYTRDDFHG